MSETLMTIREMCESFDVTPRALRFYESKELLRPIREGQKRLYTRRDRGRLKLILRGKRFGFSLESIRELLDLYDVAAARDVQLERVLEAAIQRRAELASQRDELDTTIAELDEQIAIGRDVLVRHTQHTAA